MSSRIWHLSLIIFLIMAISCVASGQDKPNLLIGGIWQTADAQAKNAEYAKELDAEYVRTYYTGWEGNPDDIEAVDEATPRLAPAKEFFSDVKTGNSATEEGWVYRDVKDLSTGDIVSVAMYQSTNLNGLTDELLNPSKDGDTRHYTNIYAHSGGARTAVTALLYQGITADRLVLISPAKGNIPDENYFDELQRLLDSGIVNEIVVYQSDADKPFLSSMWQGKFKEGDIKGNFEIIPLSGEDLFGSAKPGGLIDLALEGNTAHIQMWSTALDKERERSSLTPAPKSTEEKLPLALVALMIGSPLLSPSDSGIIWLSDQSRDAPETSGDKTYFDKANDVWYVDAFSWSGDRSLHSKPAAPYRFISGERNTFGYNWIYLPYERTGLWYTQGYKDWVTETLASMGMSGPTAGYGPLM